MGPFSIVPFMECNHGVISLYHKLQGNLIINDTNLDFDNGIGYIEKDWGISFPKTYLWTQCNDFKDEKSSIMVSIAKIPFKTFTFTGCICIIYYEGIEYRLATYKGVKIIEYNNNGLIIEQGKYRLEVKVINKDPQKLLAPSKGDMNRVIHENAACTAVYKFYEKEKMIFELASNNASFEYVI